MADVGGSSAAPKVHSGTGTGSGSGSGSGSDDSGQTVRQTVQAPQETTTFTFSSKRSPFAHTSPGAITFTSLRRVGSDVSRDRSHRRQPGAAPVVSETLGPDWIPLRPLQPVNDLTLQISSPPKPEQIGINSNTAVFAGRETRNFKVRQSPRLSLITQHHHATSRHPFFDEPPHLVTPPPQDPFTHLASSGSYFPPINPKHSRSSKYQPSSAAPTAKQSDYKHTSRAGSSRGGDTRRTHTAKSSKSSNQTPAPRKPSLFLTNPKPGPQPPPTHTTVRIDKSALLAPSQTATPTQFSSRSPKSRSPKSTATGPMTTDQSTPQPSIAIFRDCFGVLTATENVFPVRAASARTRTRSGSCGSDLGSGSGGYGSEFQKRWTKRWLRRTMRGVGSMGSGSASGGSGGSVGASGKGKGKMRASSTSGHSNPTSYLRAPSRTHSSGSQDSLDRVRVSRSNAASPIGSGAVSPLAQCTDLSDVDEADVEVGRESPDNEDAKIEGGVDGGTHMQEMMHELKPTVDAEALPTTVAD